MTKRVSLRGQGASIFFGEQAPSPASAEPAPPHAATMQVARSSEPAVAAAVGPNWSGLDSSRSRPQAPADRTADRPSRPLATRSGLPRTTTRHAFEIYQDQVDELRRLALNEKINGGDGNMSQMVRQALDTFLQARGRGR